MTSNNTILILPNQTNELGQNNFLKSSIVISYYNFDLINQNNLSDIKRIGFIWSNNGCQSPFGHTSSNYHYFSQEFINLIKLQYDTNNNLIIDLITCNFNTLLAQNDILNIKKLCPNIKINYSTNKTGNSLNNSNIDWIMESNGENIKNIYFNDKINNFTLLLDDNLMTSLGFTFNLTNKIYKLESNIIFTQNSTGNWTYISELSSGSITNFPIDWSIGLSLDSYDVEINGNNKQITINTYGGLGLFNGLFTGANQGNTAPKTHFNDFNFIVNGKINESCGTIWSNLGVYATLNIGVNNCTCIINGSVGNKAGGLIGSSAGRNNGSVSLNNSYVIITENIGNQGGGLIGSDCGVYYITSNEMTNCFSIVFGNLTNMSGGLSGTNYMSAIITNCYSIICGSIQESTYLLFSGTNGGTFNNVNGLYLGSSITYLLGNESPLSSTSAYTSFSTFNANYLSILSSTNFSQINTFNINYKKNSSFENLALRCLLKLNTNTLLQHYDIIYDNTTHKTNILYPNSNLSESNLSNYNLTNINFNGSNLSRANLSETILSGANLTGANLLETNITNAILTDTILSSINTIITLPTLNDKFYGDTTKLILNGTISVPNYKVELFCSQINTYSDTDELILTSNTSSFNIPKKNIGTYYYYCKITNQSDVPENNWVIYTNIISQIINPKQISISAIKQYDGTTNLYDYVTIFGLASDEILLYTNATSNTALISDSNNYIKTITFTNVVNGLLTNYILPQLTYDINLNNVLIISNTIYHKPILTNIELNSTDLRGSNSLMCANLIGAKLIDVVVDQNTNLSYALLDNISSYNIIGTTKLLPKNWKIIDGFLIGPNAYLSGLNLSNINMSNMKLTNVNFTGSNLTNVKFNNTQLYNVNFSGTILNGVDFTGALIVSSIFSNVVMDSNTYFASNENYTSIYRNCYLNNIKTQNIQTNEINPFTNINLPNKWKFINGYFVSPGANLINASFKK